VADAQELVRKGIEVARSGDKVGAKELFERAVEIAPNDERAWFWLASVVETDEEKRICLSRVLDINPGNERALKTLEKLQAKEQEIGGGDSEVVPGVSSRQLAIVVGGGVVVILLILVIVVFATIQQRQIEAEIARQTQVVIAAATGTESAQQTQIAAATATSLALATPTPTIFIPNRPTLPPPFTPTPEPTDASVAAVAALPFPPGLNGVIAGWSGRDVASTGYLPVGVFNLSTGAFQAVGTKTGRDVRLDSSGSRLIYTRYDEILFSLLIETINLNGSEAEVLSERWRGWDAVLKPSQPAFSPDSQTAAFVAVDQRENVEQVYIVSLAELPPGANPTTVPSPLRRVTTDMASYSFPSWSPDGTRLVAVRNDLNSGSPGPDLVFIDVQSGGITPLTGDLGTFIETMPRFSPDGSQIVYAAAPVNEPENFDIILRTSDGAGTPRVIPALRSPAVDTSPVFSPDGRFIAFASNRNGQFDIFVYELQSDTLYQLTNSPEPDYPTDWWQPAAAPAQ
jgi:hypothetical protein